MTIIVRYKSLFTYKLKLSDDKKNVGIGTYKFAHIIIIIKTIPNIPK